MYDNKKAHYVVLTAIIIKDGKYLIAKRSGNELVSPCKWTVPGGKLETADYVNRKKDTSMHWYNVFESLVEREVREETSLEIKNLRYLTSLSFIRPDGMPTVVASFFADYAGGSVILSDELTDHAWVTLEEAREYDLIEGIHEELEMLDKLLRGEKAGLWKNH
jgi:ADP-ribose pyrophosphatase YjhB (NUDIX family)